MKKVKFLALLACLVFALSVFTMSCMTSTNESEEESATSEQVSEPASDIESDPESVIESETASDPESETESDTEPELLSVTFMVDGEVYETCYFTAELPEILEPTVPAKEGYVASWEDYSLGAESITVNAVYVAIEYTITFVGYEADPIVFTVETMADVVFPTLPAEDGYDIYWDKTEEDIVLDNMTVNYVREIAKYTVTFVGVDGIDPIVYTADEMASVVFPEAPACEGYEVRWDKTEADLTLDDLTVNYVKVAIEYTITFVGVDGIDPIVFTVETLADVVIPEAPAVDGYLTGWDKSIADVTLADIEFTYYKLTEEEFYLRDVEGVSMTHVLVPFNADNNYVEWVDEENAYHYVNTLGNTDDDNRSLLFNREYVIKWAEYGVKSIVFDVKLDAEVAGEILYRGFSPDWWTNNFGVDMWQLTASDWRQIVVNIDEIPMDGEGVLKTIFLLGDKGSGLWIKNVQLYNPDFANFTDKDLVGAFTTHYLAVNNRVDYDEQEGAVLFTNQVADQDDKRGFWMNSVLSDAITAKAEAITFQVKATESAQLYCIATTQNTTTDKGWFSWGANSFASCPAGEWTTVRFAVTADIERIALLITNGSFYVKDFAIVLPLVIPEIDELTNESLAMMFTPTAGGSGVVWDETEGAFRFIMDDNAVVAGDNSRSFTLNPQFMAKLRAVTNSISFKVKFLSDTNPVNDDRNFYVSYATDGMDGTWAQRLQGVAWQADTWVEVTTVFNADPSLTLFLLNSTNDFLVKDFSIPQDDVITVVHEYEVTPVVGVVTGLGLNTVEQMPFVDDAPEGVNGTAIKLGYTNIWAGFAVSFPEYTGSEGNALSLRIYAESSAEFLDMWFYNIEYTGAGGDHSDYKANNILTNQWVDVIIDISNLPAFLNSEGEFEGFQVGLFSAGITNFYIDSISVVTITETSDIPLVG